MRVLEDVLTQRAKAIQLQSATDYRSYRHWRSKQLAHTRRALKISVRPNKATKSTWKPKSVSADDVVADIGFASVLVNSAEHAWSNAMETKAVLETQKDGESGKGRRHVVSKLAKAVKYATILTEKIQNVEELSEVEKLEAWGYQALLDGALRFEQGSWSKVIESLSAARVICSIIGKEVMKDVTTSVIDPSLSFAVYQAKRSRSVDIPTLAQQVVAKSDSAAGQAIKRISPEALEVKSASEDPCTRLGDLVWRSHTARVTNPDLASAILSARENHENEKIATFDVVLQGWQEALDIIKLSIEEIEGNGGAHDETSQSQYIVQTYISWNLLQKRIHRDVLLIEQLNKRASLKNTTRRLENYRDNVRLYETILQSISQLNDLPGVNQDDELVSDLKTAAAYFKAIRQQLIARAYAVSGDRVTALALYNAASKTVSSAKSLSATADLSFISQKQLSHLQSELEQDLLKAHGLAVLSTASRKSNEPIIDSLNMFTTENVLNNLVDLNPKLKPAPVKPVFFDIAYNYIQYNEQEKLAATQRIEEVSEEPVVADKKGGFFGLWRK